MSAPPGVQPTTTDPATSRATERQADYLNPRIVAREVVKVLTANGQEVRPSYVRRLVTRFIRHGFTTLSDVERFVLDYADPTGETAVRNVMGAPR